MRRYIRVIFFQRTCFNASINSLSWAKKVSSLSIPLIFSWYSELQKPYLIFAFCFYDFQECGGTLEGDEGSFSSPKNDHGDYPNNAKCVWTINVEEGHQLRINFEDFNTEYG